MKEKLAVASAFLIEAGTPHSVKNIGSSNGAELAVYVVEKRKPLITLLR